MAKAQEGDTDAASRDWRELAASLAQDNPWRGAAEAMLARAEPSQQAPGPDQQQMDDAGQMEPGERAAMIGQMVASLDRKLRENPNDVEGWQRLIRSYLVLGKETEAADALSRAAKALGPDSAKAKELADFAAAQGLKVNP
jgi:cytochrome c-type biogenesis protein CcmH